MCKFPNDIALVLLAGGQASRYNSSMNSGNDTDKLLSNRNNLTLLEYVVKEMISLGDIYIVTRGEERQKFYSKLLGKFKDKGYIQVIKEDCDRAIGPIGGIFYSLTFLKDYTLKIFFPADLPHIKHALVKSFIRKVTESRNFDLVSLIHQNGQTENTILAIISDSVRKNTQKLIESRNYRVSSLIRSIDKKRFINSAALVSDNSQAKDFFNDFDLIYGNPVSSDSKKPIVHVPVVDFNGGPSKLFRKYINSTSSNLANTLQSIKTNLLKEAVTYREKGVLSIALHCMFDVYSLDNDHKIRLEIEKLKNQIGE